MQREEEQNSNNNRQWMSLHVPPSCREFSSHFVFAPINFIATLSHYGNTYGNKLYFWNKCSKIIKRQWYRCFSLNEII
jgi:hypothetical protein